MGKKAREEEEVQAGIRMPTWLQWDEAKVIRWREMLQDRALVGGM